MLAPMRKHPIEDGVRPRCLPDLARADESHHVRIAAHQPPWLTMSLLPRHQQQPLRLDRLQELDRSRARKTRRMNAQQGQKSPLRDKSVLGSSRPSLDAKNPE